MLHDSLSWDENKAFSNERKHGIAFKLAATVFDDPLAVISHDVDHGGPEDRWITVGMTENDVLVVVVYTVADREDGSHVRIISARKATLRERREYESGEYAIREPEMIAEYNVSKGSESEDDPDMKAEYDFSKGVRGKFANARFPIFIDNWTLGYFHGRARITGITMEELINEALRHHVAATGYVAPVFSAKQP